MDLGQVKRELLRLLLPLAVAAAARLLLELLLFVVVVIKQRVWAQASGSGLRVEV